MVVRTESKRQPFTAAERVLFALFVLLGVYLLYAALQWTFAVVSARDIAHPFAPHRYRVRALDDVWPAPVAAVLRFLTGTTPVDEGIILA